MNYELIITWSNWITAISSPLVSRQQLQKVLETFSIGVGELIEKAVST